MSRHRAALLSRCTLTDRNCLAFVRDAQHVDTIEWPRVGYACDFCDTWPRRVGRCQQCRRWTGLSDCDCSADASSNMTQLVAGDTQAVAPDDDTDAVCRWCASGETASAPAPCGRTFGLLRRVVFVLEPKEGGRWQFRVAQRLAEAVLEAVGCGTVLFYGLESGADELEWQRAMAAVRRFAAAPLAHLPPHCVLDPDTPLRVSVVLATHSMQRLSDGDALRLELADGESRVLQWWVRHLGHDMLAAQRAPAVPATRISELYLISCHLFPRGATAAAANARALGALADQYGVSVMACDGEPPMFQQIALLASYIVASSASASQRRREPTLACAFSRSRRRSSSSRSRRGSSSRRTTRQRLRRWLLNSHERPRRSTPRRPAAPWRHGGARCCSAPTWHCAKQWFAISGRLLDAAAVCSGRWRSLRARSSARRRRADCC
jgi:hypothetical protein